MWAATCLALCLSVPNATPREAIWRPGPGTFVASDLLLGPRRLPWRPVGLLWAELRAPHLPWRLGARYAMPLGAQTWLTLEGTWRPECWYRGLRTRAPWPHAHVQLAAQKYALAVGSLPRANAGTRRRNDQPSLPALAIREGAAVWLRLPGFGAAGGLLARAGAGRNVGQQLTAEAALLGHLHVRQGSLIWASGQGAWRRPRAAGPKPASRAPPVSRQMWPQPGGRTDWRVGVGARKATPWGGVGLWGVGTAQRTLLAAQATAPRYRGAALYGRDGNKQRLRLRQGIWVGALRYGVCGQVVLPGGGGPRALALSTSVGAGVGRLAINASALLALPQGALGPAESHVRLQVWQRAVGPAHASAALRWHVPHACFAAWVRLSTVRGPWGGSMRVALRGPCRGHTAKARGSAQDVFASVEGFYAF